MKSMTKWYLLFFLVSLLLLSFCFLFTGCAASTDQNSPKETSPSSSTITANENKDTTVVKTINATFNTNKNNQAANNNRNANENKAVEKPLQQTLNPLDLPAGTVLTPQQIAAYGGKEVFFAVLPIDDALFARMQGKSYKEGAPAREELRYLRTLHVNATGETLIGEMVLNVAIADEVSSIFRQLYEAGYPIERMRLIDDYNASDEASMEDNNTSSFNYRTIAGTDIISRHGYGMAIDINTFYNPYYNRSTGSIAPDGSAPYVDRSQNFPYKIDPNDLCYQLFTEAGFEWGGDWGNIKDYQHFEK